MTAIHMSVLDAAEQVCGMPEAPLHAREIAETNREGGVTWDA